MSKKFLVPVDLTKNEIRNAVIQVLSASPSAPTTGQIYFDSSLNTIQYYGNTAWINPLSRTNHIGTQPWSTISGTPTTIAGYGIVDAQGLNSNLTAISGLATNGIMVKTGAGAVSARVLGSTTPAATWTNPDGVSGNPSLAIASASASVTGLMINTDKSKLDGIAAGATANSTDAYLLSRANHTGTQLSSTISNFTASVQSNRLDQMAVPTASVSMNNQNLINVGTPLNPNDAANKAYVDGLINGTDWKQSVRVGTTANITLSGTQTVDGVALNVGDRVLVKNQTTASQNGIYVVSASGWTRSSDAATSPQVTSGMATLIEEGATLDNTQWVLSTPNPITLNTTNLTFVQIGAATTYVGGTGIIVAGTTVSIDTTLVGRKVVGPAIGDGTTTTFTITHTLNTTDVIVQVYSTSTGETVECDTVRASTTSVTVTFASAPAAGAYKVVLIG